MIHFTNINGERLPEDVNKIANERYDEDYMLEDGAKLSISSELDILYGFAWSETKEEFVLWQSVYHGNYEPLREFHRNNTENPNS